MTTKTTTLTVILVALAAVAGTMALGGHGRGTVLSQDVKAEGRTASVERGAYLVKVMVCNDCHTPFKMGPNGPEPDFTRELSGHPETIGALKPAKLDGAWAMAGSSTNTAWSGPWGVSYTANLTPDQNTGLGIWTEDMFITALRTGKHMGTSREILPPMPWPFFKYASDDDLASIFAYLRTIKPVSNHVPDPTPPAGPVSTQN